MSEPREPTDDLTAGKSGASNCVPLIDTARQYLASGLCVLPAKRNGDQKMPALSRWTEYSTRLPTSEELEKWFVPKIASLCLVCGEVSGHLEVIDFDLGGKAFEPWCKLVDDAAPGLLPRLAVESTPSGGRHVFYRCQDAVGKSDKLAYKLFPADGPGMVKVGTKEHKATKGPDGKWYAHVTLIETKGNGGIILCDPSPGYRLLRGKLTELPVITADERDALLSCARMFDERPAEVIDAPRPKSTRAVGERPGDDFNQRGEIHDVLRRHGWTLTRSGENEHWCRPGKSRGTSATLKDGVFYVFTSSAPPFEPSRGYSRFAVLTLLEHGENWSQAASALSKEGYGMKSKVPSDDPLKRYTQSDSTWERDSASGKYIFSAQSTLPIADAFLEEHHAHPGGHTLRSYGDQFYLWDGSCYRVVEDGALKQRLQPWLHEALRRDDRSGKLVRFNSNPKTVADALTSIRTRVYLSSKRGLPFWIEEGLNRPAPKDLLVCLSSVLHIPTGTILPHSPNLFSTCALDFDYDPNAAVPERWLAFCSELFGEDSESIDLLHEWMGYCLTSDTSRQKIMLVKGPRRSGKGTIGRVLTKLVGAGNQVGPTISSLSGSFGLQPLIGKSLAIVSDAKFDQKYASIAIERLLCISGEDSTTIDRKHMQSLTMRLPTRFMLLSTDLPRVSDTSGAFAGRLVVLRLRESFFGREDLALESKLMEELPGILKFALEGLKRLRVRGHFLQPESGMETIEQVDSLCSPIRAFIRERCELGPRFRVSTKDIFSAWSDWIGGKDSKKKTSIQSFGRELSDAGIPGVILRQVDSGRFYEGIGLRSCEKDCE